MNRFRSDFREALEQVRLENGVAANAISNVAEKHLPAFGPDFLDDRDNGFVDGSYARRAITREDRFKLHGIADPGDLTTAINYVIVYIGSIPGDYEVTLLIHNRDLIQYKSAGLWR